MKRGPNGTRPADDVWAPLPLSERAYRRICELVRGQFGIHLASEKQFLVINRLGRHVQTLGFESYEAFVDYVESDVSGQALEVLADLISTNHTYFFREPAHFEFLRTDVLPEIEASLTRGGDNDLRLWCAAASTGEEAYTIVMTMLDSFGPRYARFNAGLLATDLSLKALRQAAAGVYSREQVQRVPPDPPTALLPPPGRRPPCRGSAGTSGGAVPPVQPGDRELRIQEALPRHLLPQRDDLL